MHTMDLIFPMYLASPLSLNRPEIVEVMFLLCHLHMKNNNQTTTTMILAEKYVRNELT